MAVAYSSGLELLRKQRLERSKRLDGLNLTRYFQDMENFATVWNHPTTQRNTC